MERAEPQQKGASVANSTHEKSFAVIPAKHFFLFFKDSSLLQVPSQPYSCGKRQFAEKPG